MSSRSPSTARLFAKGPAKLPLSYNNYQHAIKEQVEDEGGTFLIGTGEMNSRESLERSAGRVEKRQGLRHKYERRQDLKNGDYGIGNEGLVTSELMNEAPDILD